MATYVNCPECGKSVKRVNIEMHLVTTHGTSYQDYEPDDFKAADV